MNINWDLLVPLIVTTTFGIVGYFLAHRLAAARERANKRREVRVEYLINAFRAITALYAYSDPMSRPAEVAREAEKAISDVQIFGTSRQIKLFQDFVQNMDLEVLANALRNELRRELQLEKEDSKIMWLRFEHKIDA